MFSVISLDNHSLTLSLPFEDELIKYSTLLEQYFFWDTLRPFWYNVHHVTMNAHHIEKKSQQHHLTGSEGMLYNIEWKNYFTGYAFTL